MPISVRCRQCGKIVTFRDEAAGKSARCHCGRMFRLPVSAIPSTPVKKREPPETPVGTEASCSSSEAARAASLRVLAGCSIAGGLLLVFGLTVGLVVYFSVKSGEQAEKEQNASATRTGEGDASHLLDERGRNREAPIRRSTPDGESPRVEEIPKSLASMDKLTLAVTPPPADDVPPPDAWMGHRATVRGVAFTDDGRFVVSVSGAIETNGQRQEDNSIRVWDARRGQQIHQLAGFTEAVDAVSVSPGGRFAVFGHSGRFQQGKWVDSADHRVRLWDIQYNKEFYFHDSSTNVDSAEARFLGLDSSVLSSAFSPDRKRVAGVSNSGKLVMWESQSGHSLFLRKLIAVPRQRQEAGMPAPVTFNLSGINCIRFTPDGSRLLTGGGDYTVRILDAVTGEQIHLFESHQDIVWAVAAGRGRDGRLLGLSGGGSRQVVRGSGFLPGARDYAIRLWDLTALRELARFRGHERDVTSLAFCPDGRRFLSASADQTVRLWDIGTGALIRTYRGHRGFVRSVSVAPDGRAAVSGGDDGTIRYWRLPATVEDLAEALEKMDRAKLTRTERDMDAIGREVRILFPKLIGALRHGDEAIAEIAMRILRRLGEPDKEWVYDLRDLLSSVRREARQFAADALARLGADALPALSELKRLLTDADPSLRRSAVTALGRLGRNALVALDDLNRLVEREKDGEIRMEAVHAIGKIGGKTKSIVEQLIEGIAGSDSRVRAAALRALLDLGPEPAAVEACLKASADSATRNLARAALEKMPLVKTDALRVSKALEDERVEVRLMAVLLLARIGADAEGAKAALRKTLHDKDARIRFESGLALVNVAPSEKEIVSEALPVLLGSLKDMKRDDLPPNQPADSRPQSPRRLGEKKYRKKPEDRQWIRLREAIVRVGQPAAAALLKILRENGGDTEPERETRYRIYQLFIALGSKAYTTQNRAALTFWVKKEQRQAIRSNNVSLVQAALLAVASLKPPGRN